MKAIFRIADLFSFIGIFAFSLLLLSPTQAKGETHLSFLDVGQGDSILIQAPNGESVLIDGGPPGSVLSPLSKIISAGKISAIIETHPDKDHIGGLPSVISKRKVDNFFVSPYKSDEKVERSLDFILKEKNIATGTLVRGDRIILDKENRVFIDILWPPPNIQMEAGNNASIVALLKHSSSTAILTGDAPKGVEKILVSAGDPLRAQILKLGHHGSKTATSLDFVSDVAPVFSVISAGLNNRYGHPAKETLETLKKFNIDILSTMKEGTISFSTKGDGVWHL